MAERRAKLRKVLILLAPLAAALGMVLAWRDSTPANLGLGVTRAEAVRIARAEAAAKGVAAGGWNDMANLQPDNPLRHYLARTASPEERAAIERVLAPIPYRCVFENPTRAEDYIRVVVAPNGRVMSYRIPPVAKAPQVSEAQARAAAEAELRQRLGRDRAGFAFVSSGVQGHEATSSDVRRFTFRRNYAKEFAIEATVETAGAKVIGFTAAPKIAPEYTKRHPELGMPLRVVRAVTLMLTVLGALVYIIFRFVRRLREHEIPLKRTLIVAAFVFLTFAVSTVISGEGQRIDTVERGGGNTTTVQWILTLVVSAFMGALIGISWGACEADLRESYPEKLTSIDTLLGGHFSSRAVCSSLTTGVTVAAYVALLSGLESFLRLPRSWSGVAEEIAPYQTASPAFTLVMFAFVGLPMSLTLLLSAVSATHRRGRTRNAQITLAALVLLFSFFSTLGNHAPVAWSVVIALVTGTTLLLPFFAGDILAVLVSTAFAMWLAGSAALIAQPSATLRMGGWILLAGVVTAIAIGAIALRKATTDTADPEWAEERPEYARNMAERIMLRSEMDAARQAQLRVMPRVVPAVEGTRLAARHSASAEIGSDYFEFFSSSTHVSVAIADARMPGLSSALCVSMLKGLLLNYAARLTDTRDLADRVYRQLAAIFGDDLPLSFFFGRLDRATGAFSFATFGTAPHAAVVRNGEAISLEGEEYVELAPSDALVIYTARLAG
ncbi:MAG TPA: SpoIIE family protein phosphatase, partial [Thermoanaerobaculia bacterium]|nr:SpoIIE family protein phosphatase [Thermoanaerobaculia bacterium]